MTLENMLRSLRRTEKKVFAADEKKLTPACRWIRDNARALYGAALALKAQQKKLKKAEFLRLRLVCADVLERLTLPMNEEKLCSLLDRAQEDAPLTVPELRALPGMLLLCAFERLCALLPAVENELAGEISRAQTERSARDMGTAVSVLLQLPRLDLVKICEKCGFAHQLLLQDSAYRDTDRAGRGVYLSAVSAAARRSRKGEQEVCKAALALCAGQAGLLGEAGYYLLEDHAALYRALGAKVKTRTSAQNIRLFALFYAVLMLFCALFSVSIAPWYVCLPLTLCLFELLYTLTQRLLARRVPPRILPRLRPDALPHGTRALVVITAVIDSPKQALAICRQLSTIYFASAHAPVDFMVLSDFAPAAAVTLPSDEEILQAEAAAIEALNRAHGKRFYLLHRARTADRSGTFSGFERKRGALEMLNRLLLGEAIDADLACALLPDKRYQAVITLDSDTFLPQGAAEKLLGALMHPLQRGRVAVIQPRMTTLPMHVKTRAQRLLFGMGGADGYGAAASEMYQDLFARGSFMGKGIYDIALFSKKTRGLPENRILSHDLLEGELADAALCSDIACFDGHPRTVAGAFRREHRWTRGDWQLLPFLRDRRLGLLSKIKMTDNLRRSLTAPARFLALALSALTGAVLPFVIAILPAFSLGDLTKLLLLPLRAHTALDAIVRALWRQFVSRKKLLEWTTAAQADGDMARLRAALPQVIGGAALLFAAAFDAFWPGFVLGAAWLGAPLLLPFLDKEPQAKPLSMADERFLLSAARDTLNFFRHAVSEKTAFLPPDNVQANPQKAPDLRLSPTNAGLYALSLCAGREMALLTGDEMLRLLDLAVTSLEKLPVWHGIPYNWYSLPGLAPLPPRFVSAVDAGNYLLCLLITAQCVRSELRASPIERYALLPARIDALCRKMELRRLFDKQKGLFRIGFDADKEQFSENHYDMLASEAQILSFAAIMMDEVSEKHWWRLSRAHTKAGGSVLLSWSGTMFEYLMGALFLPAPKGSLLAHSQKNAVRAQKRAGRKDLFGISESASPELDAALIYRYQAHGLRALSLSAKATEGVYAPYAAALALKCDPRAAVRALKAMKARAWYDEHGFFDAAAPASGEDRVARTHMAHHQGMLLCAVCNALKRDYLPRQLFSLPRARAHALLLSELPPRRVRPLPAPLRFQRDEAAFLPLLLRAENTLPPQAHLLSGGERALLMASNGASHYTHGGIALTRFPAAAPAGVQIYAQTLDTVTRLTAGDYQFLDGSARCVNRHLDLKTLLEVYIDPETGALCLRLRLRSAAKEKTSVLLALCFEPALAPAREDNAHTTFSNLFFRFEPNGEAACLLRRRDRQTGAERALKLCVLSDESVEFCCDRARVIGREGSVWQPEGLDEIWDTSSSIETCLAARTRLTILPSEEKTVCFTVLDDENAALPTWEGLEKAYAQAYMRALSQRRERGLDMREAALACRMLSAVMFPLDAKAPAVIGDLWRLGLSGDRPILLISAQSESDIPALRRILNLFSYLRENGLDADMVWLLPHEREYEQPLRAFAQEAAGLCTPFFGLNEKEKAPLLAFCALHLDASKDLAAQLPRLMDAPALYPARGQSGTLPRLTRFNGFGGFLPDGGYAILHTPPAPWSHILCGQTFGTLVTDSGISYSYTGNSRLRRLTESSFDSVVTESAEEYFVVENGFAYSLTPRPTGNFDIQRRFEMGAALYLQAVKGLRLTLTVTASPTAAFGAREIRIENESGDERALTVICAARFALGEDGRGTAAEAGGDAVLARGGMAGTAFLLAPGGRAHTTERMRYDFENTRRVRCESAGAVGVIAREIALRPGESAAVDCFIGHAESDQALQSLLTKLPTARSLERAARAYWQERLGKMQFFLPDEGLSQYLNTFLPYQVRASRLMMRAGFYQSGGAWGFRDQLQDMLSLLYTEPQLVREHLLLCASRQYVEGDVQHWWHPDGAGVRTRISDDLLFLPYVTARYIQVTGDRDILSAHAAYLRSEELRADEHDRYEIAEITAETGSLREHCLRAIARVRLGEHGIPLMGGGDWNDGMDRVQGESAWLGFFYIIVLREFAPLCEKEVQSELGALRIRLHSAMQRAWTGKWFLRAWYLDGRSIGAPGSEVPRIDLISQCFAAFADMPRDQVKTALDAAWEYLHKEKEGITLLLSPPFAPEENAGYIGFYAPGVRENGGQYTHAVPWFMRALLMVGECDRAWQLLREALPYAHSGTRDQALHYRAEPYALAADIYLTGRGGWTWYTGSASWLYDVILCDFMGFEKRGARLRLAPRVPADWEECTILYRFGRSRYQLTAARGVPYATLDGEKAKGGWIELYDDGRAHEARFPLN